MYRDDVSSEAERAAQLERAIATLEQRLVKLRADREHIEREGRLGRYGLLLRWWGVALVVAALGFGFVAGNQASVRHRTVTKSCP